MRFKKRTQSLKLFTPDWYLSQNDDVAALGFDPFKHYRNHGWREGRWPNAIFDPSWYADNNPDVARLGTDPLEHFEFHGRFEGRRPSSSFDPASYLRLNPDVAASGVDPSEHYLRHGFAEGRPIARQERNYIASTSFGVGNQEIPVHLSRAILSMRETTVLGDKPLTDEAVAEAVRTLVQHDDARLDWRSRLLAKKIYRVDNEYRPVPDGLSYAYLELAHKLNDGGTINGTLTFDDRIMLADTNPVDAAEALMQRELGTAVKLQARLLRDRGTKVRE